MVTLRRCTRGVGGFPRVSRNVAGLAAWGWIVLGAGCGGPQFRIVDEFERREDWGRASDELARMERQSPGNAAVSFRLGRGLGTQERFAEMHAAFERSLAASRRFEAEIRRYSEFFWIQQRNLGVEAYEGRDLQRARAHFAAALAILPERDEGLALHYLIQVLQGVAPDSDPVGAAAVLRLRDPVVLRHVANGYLTAGRFEHAASTGEQLLALDPSDANAAALVASALDLAGNLAAAMPAYDRALRLDPGNTVLLANAALVALDLRSPDYALALCQRACELRPEDPDLRAVLAQALLDAGRYSDSALEWERVVARRPDDREALSTLVGLYGQLGLSDRRQEALAHLLRLAGAAADSSAWRARLERERSATDPGAWLRVAQLQSQARQYAALRQEIDARVTSQPSLRPRAERLLERLWAEERELGMALFARGAMERAATHFQRCSEIRPERSEARAYTWLARLFAGSIRELDPPAEVKLDSLPDPALYDLAAYLFGIREYERARDLCLRLRDRTPEDLGNQTLLASCYDALDMPIEAGRFYRDVASKAGADPVVFHNMAAIHVRRENYQQASEWLERGLRQSPDDHALHRLSGHVCLIRGLHDLARHHLMRVVVEDPCDLQSWSKLAVVCAALHLESERLDAERRVAELRTAPCGGASP